MSEDAPYNVFSNDQILCGNVASTQCPERQPAGKHPVRRGQIRRSQNGKGMSQGLASFFTVEVFRLRGLMT
jgi:hypothetical protein